MKKFLAILLSATMMLGLLAGCGGGDDAAASAPAASAPAPAPSSEEVIINYPTFQVGVNTSAPVIAALVEGFNAEYDGKYQIVIEEVPGLLCL